MSDENLDKKDAEDQGPQPPPAPSESDINRHFALLYDHFYELAYEAVLKEVLPARPWTKRSNTDEKAADRETHNWAYRAARIANIFAHHVIEFKKVQAGLKPPGSNPALKPQDTLLDKFKEATAGEQPTTDGNGFVVDEHGKKHYTLKAETGVFP